MHAAVPVNIGLFGEIRLRWVLCVLLAQIWEELHLGVLGDPPTPAQQALLELLRDQVLLSPCVPG